MKHKLCEDGPRALAEKLGRVGDIDLPAGAKLLLAIASADRHDEVSVDGEKFDIGPNASEHMSFGWGRHLCLGEALARLEMRIALEEFSRRLTHLYLVPRAALGLLAKHLASRSRTRPGYRGTRAKIRSWMTSAERSIHALKVL
jgi:cytochrome P450